MNYLKTIAEIALFKGKPHDIAYNTLYLIASFSIVLLIGMSTAVEAEKISQPGSYAFVQSAALGLMFYLILFANRKKERFIQGASALYGIIALSQIFAYFFVFLLKANGIAVLISLWSAAVQIYIIRETLECKTLKAVALYAGIQFFIIMLLLTMFPELSEILQKAIDQPTKTNS